MRAIIAAVIGLLAAGSALAQTAGLLPWPEVRAKIETHWKQGAPQEKLLSVEAKGKPEYSSTQRVTDSTYLHSRWYSAWMSTTSEIQGAFARQVALVTVERANKTHARFEVAALYRGEGKRWLFDKIAIGPVTELGAPGDPAQPSAEQAADIFREAWTRLRPDMSVSSVKILDAPKLGTSQQRRWLNYRLEIEATGTEKAPKKYSGKKLACKPETYSSVLRWDANASAWRPDESLIKIVNEDRDCSVAG